MGVLPTLLLIAMLATLMVLVVGLFGFFQGGEFNRKYGNKLMRARVMLQFIAIALLMLVLLSGGS
ncbi:MAG: twin transmembrane helix small protein [Geminicoccales bacterium]